MVDRLKYYFYRLTSQTVKPHQAHKPTQNFNKIFKTLWKYESSICSSDSNTSKPHNVIQIKYWRLLLTAAINEAIFGLLVW